MKAKLTFCGGAGTVTGANFLLETDSQAGGKKILIDCGSHAQERVCDDANFAAFPYNPSEIDVLIVTHAHADHIGRIPKLVRDGFKGVIYSTPATKDLAALMFDDAIKVMRNEVLKHGCGMLYEVEHTERALGLWKTTPYHEKFSIGDAQAEFLDAGHILGSAMVKLRRGDRTIIFSGDLGNFPEPLLNDPDSVAGANYLLIESVYGDRLHEERETRKARLREAIEATKERKGVLLIPSFSIERTQILLFEINDMVENEGLAPIPIYLDAPLAISVTEVFRTYADLFNPRAKAHFESGDDPFKFPGLTVIRNKGESEAIHKEANPKVIIAGAGMSAGGRIRSHEKEYLPDENAGVLFVGYQAPGTLGRRIEDGVKNIEIDGESVQVRARIDKLTGYSGHADRDQLLSVVESAGEGLEEVFVTMGEPKASMFLAQRIKDFLGVKASAPQIGDTKEINW